MHILQQQTDYLRAALEQDKKPMGFFLGAGASMAVRPNGLPLIPDLATLTGLVVDEVDADLRDLLVELIGQLPTEDKKNLEAVLNYVRVLSSLPGSGNVRGFEPFSLRKLDSAICTVVRRHVNKDLPDTGTPFHNLARWVASVRRIHAVQIFTTNYDLLIEQAFESERVTYFDGFMGSHRPRFDLQAMEEDVLPTRWSLLWKLHGSINWTLGLGDVVSRHATVDGEGTPALIYPSHLKYEQSRRLPYLAMMDRLRVFLKQPGAILVTSGYSYNDQHINEVLNQSLRSNPTASVQALLYGSIDSYGLAVQMAESLPNLSLLADDEGVIGSRRLPWEADSSGVPEKCDLGDFAAFGLLLADLVGTAARPSVPSF